MNMDILTVPLSYLHYYHNESVKNPHYTTEQNVHKQKEILVTLKKKGGIGEDQEVAIKRKDLDYFKLH